MELVIRDLNKRYASGVQALRCVDLDIPTGMYGLLGPNGAGKSTLMRTIATLQSVDSGSIMLDELDVLAEPDAVRRLLGYLPQEFGLYPKVSARRMINHFAALKGIGPARQRRELCDHLLQRTNLYDVRSQHLGGFSGGMKRRFGIALALLGAPKLVIVDEPTAGLDPEERNRFHNLLSEIAENIIVILSTHIVADVSDLCQRMAVMNRGQVILTGDPLELMESLEGMVWEKSIAKSELAAATNEHQIISTRLFAGRSIIHVFSEGPPDGSFKPASPDLQDAYFRAIREHDQLELAESTFHQTTKSNQDV